MARSTIRRERHYHKVADNSFLAASIKKSSIYGLVALAAMALRGYKNAAVVLQSLDRIRAGWTLANVAAGKPS